MVKICNSPELQKQLSVLESWDHLSVVVYPWEIYFIFLCLTLLPICKIGLNHRSKHSVSLGFREASASTCYVLTIIIGMNTQLMSLRTGNSCHR